MERKFHAGQGVKKSTSGGLGFVSKNNAWEKGGGTRELHIERHMKYLIFKELLLN